MAGGENLEQMNTRKTWIVQYIFHHKLISNVRLYLNLLKWLTESSPLLTEKEFFFIVTFSYCNVRSGVAKIPLKALIVSKLTAYKINRFPTPSPSTIWFLFDVSQVNWYHSCTKPALKCVVVILLCWKQGVSETGIWV